MGLLDSMLGAALGQPGGQSPAQGQGGLDPQMIIGVVGALLNSTGGLSGLLSRLQQGGLEEVVASWVGTGANRSVSPDALGSALGPDLMDQVAQQMGGNRQQAQGTLADLLPGLIDQLTTQGQLPGDNGLGALGSLLGGGSSGQGPDLGALAGMLGGMLRR